MKTCVLSPRAFAPLALATFALAPFVLATFALSGCVAHPEGEREERDRALDAGKDFTDELQAPELPADPGPDDFLRAAFLGNADLRSKYWAWRSALERVPQEGSPPDAALNFSYLFSDEHMSSWDRTTLGLSNDPMNNIPAPSKLDLKAGKALEEARAAGLRFEAAKFQLQADVLSAWWDFALHGELMRLADQSVDLIQLAADETAARVGSGSSTQDRVRAETQLALARNDLATLHAELPTLAAKLNALIGRPVDAPLAIPSSLPEPQPLLVTDAEIIHAAAERSPELAALEREVGASEQALELARKADLPDFGLSFSITGSLEQTLGGMLTLPTRREAIDAGIKQAQADLRAARAARVQYGRDLTASFVLDLYVLHNAERQSALFEETIVPRAQLLVDASRSSYGVGRGGLQDIVEAERMLLDARQTAAELRAEREKAVIAIETWSKLDVEALHPVRGGTMGGP